MKNDIFAALKSFEAESTTGPIEDIFKKIGQFDSLYSDNVEYNYNVEGILINIGTRTGNIDILNYAMKRLRNKIDNYKSDLLHYNIANGLLALSEIKYSRSPSINTLIEIKELREARKHLYYIKDNRIFPQAMTNYANILEKYSRNYEAILFYDKVLKVDSDFGMALGNKGIAIKYYFDLTHQKDRKLILMSRELLQRAIESPKTAMMGGSQAVEYFKSYLAFLDNIINANNIANSDQNDIQPKNDYEAFCMKYNLLLNYCFNCYRCEKGLTDEFAPSFLSTLEDSKAEDIVEHGGMPSKIYYSIIILNQIIEDYSTARYIYYLSTHSDLDSIDAFSQYFSALDYCRNSIRYGFKKTSFIKLFNILDKISHLIWSYYQPSDLKKTYFNSLLRPEYVRTVITHNNHSLLALYDLALDFQEGGIFNRLNKIRNFLTHDFIDIKEEMNSASTIDEEFHNKHHLTHEMMDNYIVELFLIVKSALIYFVNALDTENKRIKPKKKNLVLNIPTQKSIFPED